MMEAAIVKKSLVDSPNEKLLEEIEFYKQAYVDLKTINTKRV